MGQLKSKKPSSDYSKAFCTIKCLSDSDGIGCTSEGEYGSAISFQWEDECIASSCKYELIIGKDGSILQLHRVLIAIYRRSLRMTKTYSLFLIPSCRMDIERFRGHPCYDLLNTHSVIRKKIFPENQRYLPAACKRGCRLYTGYSSANDNNPSIHSSMIAGNRPAIHKKLPDFPGSSNA